MSKKSGLTRSDNASYMEFIQALTLVTLRLASCRSEIEARPYFELMDRKKGRVERKIDADYLLGEFGTDYFDSIGKFKLEVDDGKGGKKPLAIECVFQAHFHTKKVKEDYVRQFTNSEFRLILWPYFRQLVSDVTARMSIPPVTVPFSTKT